MKDLILQIIKETIDGRQSLDKIIYDFLENEYYPDYNWGPELFDFYREDVEKYGSITFYIDDSVSYYYYENGTLEIMPSVYERLNSWFNDSWPPVFKKWFEENSGLKVKRVVTEDDTTLINESSNKDKNKKLIRLTESDLTSLIKRVINEQISLDDIKKELR
jgi:hypothetical protein